MQVERTLFTRWRLALTGGAILLSGKPAGALSNWLCERLLPPVTRLLSPPEISSEVSCNWRSLPPRLLRTGRPDGPSGAWFSTIKRHLAIRDRTWIENTPFVTVVLTLLDGCGWVCAASEKLSSVIYPEKTAMPYGLGHENSYTPADEGPESARWWLMHQNHVQNCHRPSLNAYWERIEQSRVIRGTNASH